MSPSLNGVLILNKPQGWTSHDVVAKTRGILKERQIGHLGTLDPLATGVLPLALGAATRLIEFSNYSKEYRTTCLLGKATDSYDITGKTLAEKTLDGLAPEAVGESVLKLASIIEQVPPMVSAVKKDGRKLYELARRGVEVERKARPVKIENPEILKIELPRATFRLTCSAGTYVRSLCQTMGEELGVGGCMEALERTRVGPFSIREAVTLEELKKGMDEGGLSAMLLPASRLADHLPEVKLDEKDIALLCQGQSIQRAELPGGLCRVMNERGRLSAIAEGPGAGVLKPKKVFSVEGID